MADADGLCPYQVFDPRAIDDVLRGEGDCSLPPGLDGLRALVRAARAPGSGDELRDCLEVAERMAASWAFRPGSTDPRGGENQGRMRMFGKRRIARVVPVVAATAAVLGGGAAAAAVGAPSSPYGGHAVARPHVEGVPHGARDARLPSLPSAVRLTADHASGTASTGRPWVGPAASGKVTSVDGASAAGSCGVAGGSGSFVVTGPMTMAVTVNVNSATKFIALRASGASFADVCVGDYAAAQGTAKGTGAITATSVFVATPPPAPVHSPGAFGKVTSVDGDSAAGSCGVAGGSGSFVVVEPMSIATPKAAPTTMALPMAKVTTVDVTGSTKFFAPKASGASFADVCVGDDVAARGTADGTAAITATVVYVAGPMPFRHPGPMPFTTRFFGWQVRHDPRWAGGLSARKSPTASPPRYDPVAQQFAPSGRAPQAQPGQPAQSGAPGSWHGQAGARPAPGTSSGPPSWGAGGGSAGWSGASHGSRPSGSSGYAY
jgi:hypothetical protein